MGQREDDEAKYRRLMADPKVAKRVAAAEGKLAWLLANNPPDP